MRLINTETGQLAEFFDADVPPYAILSHRWLRDAETAFKDYNKRRDVGSEGRRKIEQFCAFARGRGHQWIWADTVCIDKRSSAELSEAINSMYRWYAKSDICYAYLADVDPQSHSLMTAIKQSDWFTRTWTLQELLAPRQVVFVSAKWSILGRKVRRDDGLVPHYASFSSDDIQTALSERTGIPIEVLRDAALIPRYSVAQRLSWAAGRESTRVEDTAYSLLGLFGVAMPLLYGEGIQAFQRLQLEIIRSSHDESIFAWRCPKIPSSSDAAPPIFAASPQAFEGCGRIARIAPRARLPWAVTNHGLQMPLKSGTEIQLFRIPSPNLLTLTGGELLVFPISLNCEDGRTKARCKILLVRMSCGHFGRLRTQHISKEFEDCKKWRTVALESNSSSRTSLFVHLGKCEDLGLFSSSTDEAALEYC